SFYLQALERHHTDTNRAIAWNHLGNAYQTLDRLGEAAHAYRQSIQLDPAPAWPYHNLAVVLTTQKKYDEAIPAYQDAVERHDTPEERAGGLENLGVVLTRQKRYDDAIAVYIEALEISPRQDVIWTSLGYSYAAQDDTERAILSYREAITYDDTAAAPWRGLGQVHQMRNEIDEAVEAYETAIQLDPVNPWPYHYLALLYSQGKTVLKPTTLDTASRYYQEAIERHEDTAVKVALLYHWGTLYQTNDLPDEALTAYRRAAAIDNTHAATWYQIASLSLTTHRLDDAWDAYQRVIELESKSPWPYHYLGLIAKRREEYGLSRSYFQQALQRHQPSPDAAITWYHLGGVYHRINEFKLARAAYRQATRLNDTLVQPWRGLGDLHAELREYDEAGEAYHTALKIDPTYAPVHNSLGLLYEQAGDDTRAMQSYQQAVESTSLPHDRAIAYNSLGDIYRRQQREKDAILAYQQATELDPDYPWPYYNLGAIYDSQGATPQALELYAQARKKRP
ncbi:MAG: tetratricopeptide repeat protein, partial [Okeania sp. SIO3B3]|nr:tetratricopeptide repeat protein [Okeania sp. SIO3B3]